DVRGAGTKQSETGGVRCEQLDREIARAAQDGIDLLAAIFLNVGIARSIHAQTKDGPFDSVERQVTVAHQGCLDVAGAELVDSYVAGPRGGQLELLHVGLVERQ